METIKKGAKIMETTKKEIKTMATLYALAIGLCLFLAAGCFEEEKKSVFSSKTEAGHRLGYNADGSVQLNVDRLGRVMYPAGWPCFAPLDSKGLPPWHPDKHMYVECPSPYACEDHAESAPHGGKAHWLWPHRVNPNGSWTYFCKEPSWKEIYRVDEDNGFEMADPRSTHDPKRDGPPPHINMNTFLPER
jgi:hypothetical protein